MAATDVRLDDVMLYLRELRACVSRAGGITCGANDKMSRFPELIDAIDEQLDLYDNGPQQEGRANYEAYCAAEGNSALPWGRLSPKERAAWQAGGLAAKGVKDVHPKAR